MSITPKVIPNPKDLSPLLPTEPSPTPPVPEPTPEPAPQQIPSILLTDDRGRIANSAPQPMAGVAEVPGATSLEPKRSIPGILLSGDGPSSPAAPTPPELPLPAPETPSVWVGAQDPHTICVQWDLPAKQFDSTPTEGVQEDIHLRVMADAPAPQCVSEQRVDLGTHVTFVPVPNAGTPYHAEIGTRSPAGEWHALAESAPTHTPPAAPARTDDYTESTWIQPRSIPESIPDAAPSASETPSLSAGFATEWDTTPASPETQPPIPYSFLPPPIESSPPTVRASRQLTRLSLGSDAAENGSSHSLTRELAIEETTEESSTIAAAPTIPSPGLPSSDALVSNSAESGPERETAGGSRKFWFRINTEVVIYGSTEPGATVTIGDQEVKVRPDGTFSFRFALPDGAYPLPVVAASADRQETLAARVELSRTTGLQGPVEAHPQCPSLQLPLPENCR